ncbi:MAG: CHAT domain-containing protein [Verrucomicrobiaceae bacterium]
MLESPMPDLKIHLQRTDGGTVRTTLVTTHSSHEFHAGQASVDLLLKKALELTGSFESGKRPLADPVSLSDFGHQIKDTLLGPLWAQMEGVIGSGEGTLIIASAEADILNLPWELLPSPSSGFLVADGRWAIRRTMRDSLPQPKLGQAALPLRILFVACAPTDQAGLDYEREEEAMLRLAAKLGNKVHLSIAEAATYEELRNLISELKPHVVHLSGHGTVQDGVGYFTFEDERGRSDLRDARSMAEELFANRGVRVVFVSGCQSAQAASAGVCQALTAAGHVPVALGWGASIADGLATDFASVFYHELAAGRPVDASAATARRDMFGKSQFTVDDKVFFDASFALPQVFVSDATDDFIDQSRPSEKVHYPGVRYELLGDGIIGLKEGFVGRRRLLQRLRPGLRDGDIQVLLLTGIGGAGKSTLATRLANRCGLEGFHVVPVKAGRKSSGQSFGLKLVQELGIACQRLGRKGDCDTLTDGNQPLSFRLRLAVEILKETRMLLVLDNLEDLMPQPPAAPRWLEEELGAFFEALFTRLTGEGRCIMTCRYVPEGFDSTLPGLLHELLPDFSEAEFIKCLTRNERVVQRMAAGEISREFLSLLHRKIGGTPRFIKQAADVLAQGDITKLQGQLKAAPDADGGDALGELREKYLEDIFVPQLYQALSPSHRLALSRLALVEPPVPLDGIACIGGLDKSEAAGAAEGMLARGLLQKLGEDHETTLFAIYPLQRDFLAHPDRLSTEQAVEAHRSAAAYFEACFKADREGELRLHFMAELLACRHHSEAGGDRQRLEWSTRFLAQHLHRSAEYRASVALLEPLADDDAAPETLRLLADSLESLSEWLRAKPLYHRALARFEAIGDRAGEAATWHQLATIDLNEGNYAAAREKFGRSLEMRQAIGDRAGEAATWHQLASIDVNEGNYAAAREKFGRSLEMRQAIGDRAGEAATLAQISFVAWENGRHETGARLQAVACLLLKAIGAAEQKVTWENVTGMASDLELDQEGFNALLQDAMTAYQQDRATGLVRQALERL